MYGAPLNVDELAVVFGYRNRRGVNRDCRLGRFPIPTYSHNGKRFAHADHVNEWLVEKKCEAEQKFQKELEDWDR